MYQEYVNAIYNNKAHGFQDGWLFNAITAKKSSELNRIEEAHYIQAKDQKECIFLFLMHLPTAKIIKYE